MDQAKDAVSTLTNTLSPTNIVDKANTKTGMFIIGAIIGVVILVFSIIVLYWIINRSINNRKQYTIPQTKVPVVTSNFQSFEADNIPTPGNGKRMTFTFWIYIHDLNKYQGSYRNVMYRGDMVEPKESHSPMVILDAVDNRMHVVFGTEKADPYDGNKSTISGTDTTKQEQRELTYLIATRGITIDYIPIQRWVHVAIVVNEEVNGGIIQAYLDGELVKYVRTEETAKTLDPEVFKETPAPTAKLNIQNMNLDKRGNIYIGGNMNSPMPGFSGLVSRVSFFNYDLNVRDIYNVYMQGPVDGLASKMGAAYGVRTPIYRVG